MTETNKKNSLKSLFFPIFFEAFLVTLVGVIDTAMVSTLGDNAVGAVGTSNNNLHVVNTAMQIVSIGAAAIMSRFVGAKEEKNAVRALGVSCALNFALSSIFSLVLFFFSRNLHVMLGTAPEILDDAVEYTKYVGLSSVFIALNYVFTAYLRSFGKPKLTFVSATAGNIVNIIFNAVFISRGMGAAGVAIATLMAHGVTLLLSVLFSLKIKIADNPDEPAAESQEIIRSILKIGIPAAGEILMWTIWNAVNIFYINKMGATAVNAYSYLMQITNMINCIVVAYTQTSSVIVGWNIGARDFDTAENTPNRAFLYGAIIGLSINALLIPLSVPVLSLFTEDKGILAYAMPIFAINMVRYFGKLGNNVFGMALKTAGDAKSPLIIGVFIMPFWTFFGAYFLGIFLGWGLYGYWTGVAMDELTRCFMMRHVWRKRKWQKRFELT